MPVLHLFAAAFLFAPPAPAQLPPTGPFPPRNNVVCVVEELPVTAWDLTWEQAVLRQYKLPADRDAALKGMLRRILLAKEAQRFARILIPDARVDEELARFKKSFASDGAYRNFMKEYDLDEAALKERIYKELLARDFLAIKRQSFPNDQRDAREKAYLEGLLTKGAVQWN